MFLSAVFVIFLAILNSSKCASLHSTKVKAVELSYICMRVTDGEKNNKSPILLLHGLGSSKEGWMGLYQVLALRTGRRVCAADLRNHGDSPWVDESSVGAMAADVDRLIDALNETKVVILGHSLGGKVAVHTALNYPNKVDGIIVEDMRPNGITERALKEVQVFMTLLKAAATSIPANVDEKTAKLTVIRFINEQLKKINSPYSLDEKLADLLPIRCSNGKCQWKINLKLADKVRDDPTKFLTESKGVFDGPALFIYGTVSPFKVGESSDEIWQLFPKAKIVPVEGAGHIIHGLYPQFLEEVIKFLS